MKMFLLVSAFILILASGCGNMSDIIDPTVVDDLEGNWAGTLDYTPSGGAVAQMTLGFEQITHYWLSATMTSGITVYSDNVVTQVDDDIVMNFPVASEDWELVLEGKLTTLTKFEGNIVQREAGKDDVALGTFSATRA
jgi:hypothetical protein